MSDPNQPVVFDQHSAGRIGEVVKRVEQTFNKNTTPGNFNPTFYQFFWATISNETLTSGHYSYDFEELKWESGTAKTDGRDTAGFGQISAPNYARQDVGFPVFCRIDLTDDGTGEIWIIGGSATLPPGTAKYQVPLTSNDAGTTWAWDWIRVHA